MTSSLPASPELETFIDDLWQARYGDPRFGHEDFAPFPALIARADELGDDYWRFVVRLEAAYAGVWAGTASDVLTLLAWLLRTYDRNGAALDLHPTQIELLNTTLADFLESVADMPELSGAQVEAILDDWIRRARGTEYEAPSLVAMVRARLAWHAGAFGEGLGILAAVTDFTPPAGGCEQGARASIALLASRFGDNERALALSEPDLVDDGERCGFFPAETYVPLMASYAAADRRAEVIRGAEFIDRLYGPYPGSTNQTDAIAALLRVGELARAHAMALLRLPHLDSLFTSLDRAEMAAVLSAVFSSIADADSDAIVTQRTDPGRPADVRKASELAAELADIARELAHTFDVRNANDVVSSSIEDLLALRAPGVSSDRVKSVSERNAMELMSGMTTFGSISERRAIACAEALPAKLDELSGRDLARAHIVLASDLRRTDPVRAIDELRTAAADAEADYPGLAAQAALMANLTALAQGMIDPEVLLQAAPPDPTWSALSQASYLRLFAVALRPYDPDRALATVSQALEILRAGRAREMQLSDTETIHRPGSREADAVDLQVALHMIAATVHGDLGNSQSVDADRALLAARESLALAESADQILEAHAELAEVLAFAAHLQSTIDTTAALRLSDEAVEHARYVQRAALLMQRAELQTMLENFDGAINDYEQAVAVFMIEGIDAGADHAVIDLSRAQLARGDEPRAIIEAVRPVIDRMAERDGEDAALNGVLVLARAQIAARLPADAVVSLNQLLEATSAEDNPGFVAQLHQSRGGELMDLDRGTEAIADFDMAATLYDAAGAQYEVGEVLRDAALSAHFSDDDIAAQGYLARAERVYDELSVDMSVDYERARLDLARADIIRATAPEQAETLLAAVVERARVANWELLMLNALQLSALTALSADGDDARARAQAFVDEGLRRDPEHQGLNMVAIRLAGEDEN